MIDGVTSCKHHPEAPGLESARQDACVERLKLLALSQESWVLESAEVSGQEVENLVTVNG